LVDNWLRHVQDVRWKNQTELDGLPTEQKRHDRLCELNVVEQVLNVSQTTVVRDAWARGQQLEVHGWIYDLHDGLLWAVHNFPGSAKWRTLRFWSERMARCG